MPSAPLKVLGEGRLARLGLDGRAESWLCPVGRAKPSRPSRSGRALTCRSGRGRDLAACETLAKAALICFKRHVLNRTQSPDQGPGFGPLGTGAASAGPAVRHNMGRRRRKWRPLGGACSAQRSGRLLADAGRCISGASTPTLIAHWHFIIGNLKGVASSDAAGWGTLKALENGGLDRRQSPAIKAGPPRQRPPGAAVGRSRGRVHPAWLLWPMNAEFSALRPGRRRDRARRHQGAVRWR